MYCKKCGKEIKKGHEYCTDCKIDINNKNTIDQKKIHTSTITKDKLKFFIISSILLIVIIFLVDLCIYKVKISLGEKNNIVYIKNSNFQGIYSDLIIKKTDGKYGLIDTNGSEIIPCDYDFIYDSRNGYAMISKDKKYGLIDENGKIIIPCIYQSIGFVYDMFVEDLIIVKKNDQYGFMNKNGEEIIPCKYDEVSNFSEGLAYFKVNDKYGFINTSGKEIIPCSLDFVFNSFNGDITLVTKNGQTRFIDKNGASPYILTSNGEKKYGIKDINGKIIVPSIYTSISNFEKGFIAEEDNKIYFINTYGKILKSYDGNISMAATFENGLLRVEKNGKYGFVNKSGTEVVPTIYEETGSFSEELVKVKKDGKYGFVNSIGKEIVPCIYDDVSGIFIGGQVNVKRDDKWGIVDTTGKEIVPCEFSYSIESNGKIICKSSRITDMNQNTILSNTQSVSDPIIGTSILLYLFLFISLFVYFFKIKDGCKINIIELFKYKYSKIGNTNPIKSESLLETIDIKKQSSSVADQLFKYADLLEKGLITRDEFEDFKNKLK